MAMLGVLFALDKGTVDKLKSFKSDEDRLDFLQGDIETDYFENHADKVCELDKAWDAIDRALTESGHKEVYLTSHVILGGESLYSQQDYIMSLKTPEQVNDIAKALGSVTEESFREKYFKINPDEYGFELSEEDFEYSWTWFADSFEFWKMAAAEGRYVLFTVDQ
jgi:hypothetical protein